MKTDMEQLVEGCKRKDPKAQRSLYDEYAPKLLGLCMRYTHSRDEAQDLLHDGFIKIFESIGTLSNPQVLEVWMQRIMSHLCIDYLTRDKQLRYTDLNSMEEYLSTEEDDSDEMANDYNGLSMEQIVNAIQSLPSHYQLIFNLCGVEERSTKEVAEMLHLSENNIRQILLRARSSLKKKLRNRINTI